MSSPPVQMKAIDPDGEIVDLGEESDDYDDDFGDEEEEEEEIGEEDDQGDDEEDDDYEEDYEEEAGSGGLTALLLGNACQDNGDGEEEEGQDQEYVEATIAPTPVPSKGIKRALSEPEADGGDVSPSKNGERIAGTAKKAKVL